MPVEATESILSPESSGFSGLAEANGPPDALELQNLRKDFGNLAVIQDLSLRLARHRKLALIGPSGCGKSTVLNLISGLDTKYQGRILLSGQELRASKNAARSSRNAKGNRQNVNSTGCPQVGYMLQKDLLLPWRNIEQNVFLPQELHHLETYSRQEVDGLFALFGLERFRKAYPRQLSGGMRQRANLLRTYTLKSDLLLLDEPFGALDALTKQSLQYWFLEMSQQQQRSILLITHDIREAILLADSIVVLSGRPCHSLAQFEVHHIEHDAALEREIFGYLRD